MPRGKKAAGSDKLVAQFVKDVEKAAASLVNSIREEVETNVRNEILATLGEGGTKTTRRATAKRGPGRPAKATTGKKRGRKKGPAKPCSVHGCKRDHYAKGLCSSHYQQMKNGTLVEKDGKWVKEGGKKPGRPRKTAKGKK